MKDITVDSDGTFTEGFEVDSHTEGAADQAADLDAAAIGAATFRVALLTGGGTAGQHRVLGSDPATAGITEEGRDTLFDAGGTENPGVSLFDQD